MTLVWTRRVCAQRWRGRRRALGGDLGDAAHRVGPVGCGRTVASPPSSLDGALCGSSEPTSRAVNGCQCRSGASVGRMARPYGDPVEIVTAPTAAQSAFIPVDSKIVMGAVAPASPDPIPIVLLPGFEYRMREWRHPTTHEIHWRLEREKVHPARRRRRIASSRP